MIDQKFNFTELEDSIFGVMAKLRVDPDLYLILKKLDPEDKNSTLLETLMAYSYFKGIMDILNQEIPVISEVVKKELAKVNLS